MKRTILVLLAAIMVISLSAAPVLAAKPQVVIERSNGFPSGMHFNLNIHGKDPAVFSCVDVPGGNSVFVPLFDTATIQYVSNAKKSNPFPDDASPYELYALDPCAVAGDKTAKVYLPTKVAITAEDGSVSYKDAGGYYVFGRILGKPNNGGNDAPSKMILGQNEILQACNDAGEDAMDCELALGLIIGGNTYVPDPMTETYERFGTSGKGKGNLATDITRLFIYTGWVYWGEDPDTDSDGDIDADDIPEALTAVPPDFADYPGIDFNGNGTVEVCEWALYHPDINGDGVVDEDDATLAQDYDDCAGVTIGNGYDPITLAEWQVFQEGLNHAQYFEEEWIFNIAELVVTAQGIENFGTRLMQIRFYPMNFTSFTNEFTPEP